MKRLAEAAPRRMPSAPVNQNAHLREGCASEKAVDIPARALSRSGSTVGGGFGHPLSPASRAPVAVLSGCQKEPTPGGSRRQARGPFRHDSRVAVAATERVLVRCLAA